MRSEFIYGKNPILETLRASKRRVRHLFLAESAKTQENSLQEVFLLTKSAKAKISRMPKNWFEQKFPGVLTQNWAAEVDTYPYSDFETLAQNLTGSSSSLVLALDQIQDPQNLGAILRSAEGVGVDAVILPERNSVEITASVCKAAAGAEEHLTITQVTNLSRSLQQLKESGFWIVGTKAPSPMLKGDEEMAKKKTLTSQSIFEFDWPQKTVLILGSEGSGMRRLTEENCDFWIYLPLLGKLQSLNVSAAAAVCFYQYRRQWAKNEKE